MAPGDCRWNLAGRSAFRPTSRWHSMASDGTRLPALVSKSVSKSGTRKGVIVSRRSDAKQEAMLREKIGRRQYLSPLLEDGEEIGWEVGARWFRIEPNGHSHPVQEGFLALTDRRMFIVPNGSVPSILLAADIREAQVKSERKRTARVELSMQSGERWLLVTGRESSGYLVDFARSYRGS